MGKLKFDYPIMVLDVETEIVDEKLFKDMGPMAPKEIRMVCVQCWNGPGDAVEPDYFDSAFDLEFCLNRIKPATIVGHNIMRFDAPVIRRLWGIDLSKHGRLVDTLILSKLKYPMQYSHSLEAWGHAVGVEKKSMPTDDASEGDWLEYCMNDVDITRLVFYNEFMGDSVVPEATMKLEHKFAELFQEQYECGVRFDTFKAADLLHNFTFQMEKLETDIVNSIGMVDIPESRLHYPPKVQFKKDGTPNMLIRNYCAKYGVRIMQGKDFPGGVYADGVWIATDRTPSGGGTWTTKTLPLTEPWLTVEYLDLNNQGQLKDKLLDLGWQPKFWNMKDGKQTSPRLYDKDSGEVCPNLTKIGFEKVEEIKEWLTLRSRRNVLSGKNGSTGWLANSRLMCDSHLSADADTVGAITGRVTHRIVANVPRVTTKYGRELRELFGPDGGFDQVGWDAQALEARMEGHYTHKYDGGKYAKLLMEGDVHTYNMENLGLPNRDDAKTFKYAVTYGAQPPKLARTFGWRTKQAEEIFDEFWKTNPALLQLKMEVINTFKNQGYIIGLDGRRLYPRHEGAALNTLFQSAGAIVMKYAAVLADKMIKREGLKANPLIRYHDEEQWQAFPFDAHRVGELGVLSIKYAGKYLKLNVELDGEYKIGNSWAECH